MIDVLIVDDNPIVRAALRAFLSAEDGIQVVGEAADGHNAVVAARRLRPAVTLLDHRMPIADGLSVVTQLAEHTAVLVMTSDPDPRLIGGMLRGGARGYLVHGEVDPPELRKAVHAVAAGQGWLSPGVASITIAAVRGQRTPAEQLRQERQSYALTRREEEILDLICAGHSNAAIGRRLLVAEKTVKNHVNHILAKIGVTNRTEAAMKWTGRTAG